MSESAPVEVEDARLIESPVPMSESPLVGVRIWRVPCLLLKVVQSEEVRSPVAVFDAYGILKVCIPPDELILNVVPAVQMAKV